MKRSNLYAILITSLFLSSSFIVIGALPGVAKASGSGVVAVDYYHQVVGNQTIYRAYGIPPQYSDQKADMSNMWGNLTKAGFTVNTQLLNKTTPITSSDLSSVTVLFIGQLSSLSMNYTASEVAAIKNWFQTGGKTIMMSGNSDYAYGNATANFSWQAGVPNHLLAAIGSSLRLDYGEVTDQPGVGAAGAGFRVYANAANSGSINTQGWAATLTSGTTKVRFHGTTNVIGYQNGKYVTFDQLPTDTVTWLYKTSSQGTLQAQGAANPLVTSSAPGQLVLAAAEKVAEGSTYSKVVLGGAGFIGSYIIAGASEFGQNVSYNGLQFVVNAATWGATAESVPTSYTSYLIVAVVLVAIIVIAALYMMRRKPKAPAAPAS